MLRLTLIVMMFVLATACTTPLKSGANKTTETPPPKLLAPSVKKIWIPAVIKDGGQEWEEGHYLYRIERNTSWSR